MKSPPGHPRYGALVFLGKRLSDAWKGRVYLADCCLGFHGLVVVVVVEEEEQEKSTCQFQWSVDICV